MVTACIAEDLDFKLEYKNCEPHTTQDILLQRYVRVVCFYLERSCNILNAGALLFVLLCEQDEG
eukprot:1157640-Pelagomonas_calceolata.AAC.2